ncbi:MAG: alanine:cation symporter family protein, partial [Eggerthellales bacterium]|nr:alanine:cation symporter family protein [Eggerthellales bacterium]
LAKVKCPHDQGVVALVAVFIDTFVVVTITALVVLCTLWVGDGAIAQGMYEGIDKTNMAQLAFGSLMGESLGGAFVAICLLFFAFSTIISWNLFAKINVDYLFGRKAIPVFSVIAVAFVFLGCILSNDLVWELADMFNQLMVLPNAIALFALSGVVVKSVKLRDRFYEDQE